MFSLTFLQIISAELHFTLTKQDLSPIALCITVRRTFSDHTDNTGNFPPFCMSSGYQGRCHNFCLSLVFAVFPDAHQEHPLFQQQLGGVRNVLFYSVLPLPVNERFCVVKPGTFFFQCCYSHTAHGPAFPSFWSCTTVSYHPSLSQSAPKLGRKQQQFCPWILFFI